MDQVTTVASKFGKYSDVYKGVYINFAGRLPRRINLAGGYNLGNAVNVFLTFSGLTTSTGASSSIHHRTFEPQPRVSNLDDGHTRVKY